LLKQAGDNIIRPCSQPIAFEQRNKTKGYLLRQKAKARDRGITISRSISYYTFGGCNSIHKITSIQNAT
jgi:hypothetical protein